MKFIAGILATLFFCCFFALTANAQTNNSSDNKQEKPLEIKRSPQVRVGDCRQESGVIRLRVTFDKSAKITDVKIVKSSGCEDFDKRAVEAAKSIKFKPAIKNGEPVTVTKLIEYSFTKY